MAVSQAVQETGGVQVAGARRVDHRRRMRVDDVYFFAGDDHRTVRTARERGDGAVAAHAVQRLVEGVDLVEHRDLVLVREQDVDAALDQFEEIGAVPFDTEGIGERERNALVGSMGDRHGAP